MTELIAAALDLAARKLPVFPVWSVRENGVGFVCACPKGGNCTSPGKHPMVPHGVTQATTDADRVSYWWRSRPEANIGLATGTVVVIDTDPRHGGDRALAELENKHAKLPPTCSRDMEIPNAGALTVNTRDGHVMPVLMGPSTN